METELVKLAPDVRALAPVPFVVTKKELPNIMRSSPNGFARSLKTGVENWGVRKPPAPIETS
jgi:hypothetical protein